LNSARSFQRLGLPFRNGTNAAANGICRFTSRFHEKLQRATGQGRFTGVERVPVRFNTQAAVVQSAAPPLSPGTIIAPMDQTGFKVESTTPPQNNQTKDANL